jgi:GT2 family glycosyltransferase
LPQNPYGSSEAHGRGVLIPKSIFEEVGFFDHEVYPQYGGDTDFSFRVTQFGKRIWVIPDVRVELLTKNSGMTVPKSIWQSTSGYIRYLTNRKNGEALWVWWNLTSTHLSWPTSWISFTFIVLLNTYRYWKKIFQNYCTSTHWWRSFSK